MSSTGRYIPRAELKVLSPRAAAALPCQRSSPRLRTRKPLEARCPDILGSPSALTLRYFFFFFFFILSPLVTPRSYGRTGRTGDSEIDRSVVMATRPTAAHSPNSRRTLRSSRTSSPFARSLSRTPAKMCPRHDLARDSDAYYTTRDGRFMESCVNHRHKARNGASRCNEMTVRGQDDSTVTSPRVTTRRRLV